MKFNQMKRVILIAVLVASFVAVGLASAQDEPLPPGFGQQDGPPRPDGMVRRVIEAVANATGLTTEDVLAQAVEGKTLAEIAQEAGADVDAIVAEVVATQTTRLEEAVKKMMENPLPPAGGAGLSGAARQVARDLVDAVAEATGKSPQEVVALAPEVQTAAELIEAAGADVDQIIDVLIARETERINEAVADGKIDQARADELLANLETLITEAMDKPLPGPGGGRLSGPAGDIMRDLMDTVTESTGLTGRELLEQARAEGLSIRQVLEANGVDTSALVDQAVQSATEKVEQAVADGKLDQERAGQILDNLPVRIEQVLDHVPPTPGE